VAIFYAVDIDMALIIAGAPLSHWVILSSLAAKLL